MTCARKASRAGRLTRRARTTCEPCSRPLSERRPRTSPIRPSAHPSAPEHTRSRSRLACDRVYSRDGREVCPWAGACSSWVLVATARANTYQNETCPCTCSRLRRRRTEYYCMHTPSRGVTNHLLGTCRRADYLPALLRVPLRRARWARTVRENCL